MNKAFGPLHRMDWKPRRDTVHPLQSAIPKAGQAKDLERVRRVQSTWVGTWEARALAVKNVRAHPGGKTPGIEGMVGDTEGDLREAMTRLRPRSAWGSHGADHACPPPLGLDLGPSLPEHTGFPLGRRTLDGEPLEVHSIPRRTHGGCDALRNLRVLHPACPWHVPSSKDTRLKAAWRGAGIVAEASSAALGAPSEDVSM